MRTFSALLFLGLGAAAMLAATSGLAEDAVFGTRADRVMVIVSAQFTEELDEQIWHLPLESVSVSDERVLAIALEGLDRTRLYAPVPEETPAEDAAETLRSSTGHLVRLEYHPAQNVPRGRIHASWTLSSRRGVVGEGDVPLASLLYSKILAAARFDLPDSGIFAPIATAESRLRSFVDHVENGTGHETDQLLEFFRTSVDESGLPVSYYVTDEGRPVTPEYLTAKTDQGRVRSLGNHWREAVERFEAMKPVNPTLNLLEAEWARCPEGTVLRGPVPGEKEERVITREAVTEFRRAATRRFLAEAVLCSEAENPPLFRDNMGWFRQEIEAAAEGGLTIDPNGFVPPEHENLEKFEAYLAHKASGRLTFWGRMLAYLNSLRGGNRSYGNPAGR